MRVVLLLCVLLPISSACTSEVIMGEQGQAGISVPDLRSVRVRSHDPGMRVLVGSQSEATVHVVNGPASCYRMSSEGALRTGDSLTFDGVGTALFTFDPTGCQELPDALPDRLAIRVVSLEEVQARVALPQVEFGLRQLEGDQVRLVHPDDLPSGLIPVFGDTLVLVAGTPVEIDAALEHDGKPVLVGPGAGGLQIAGDSVLGLNHPLSGVLVADVQGQGEVSFLAGDVSIPVARFDVIQSRQVRRLRHAVIMEAREGADFVAGVAVWGVDGQGRRVHRLPLVIEVLKGPLTVPGSPSAGPFLFLPSLCSPPWELAGQVVERSVRLRFGQRKVDVDLQFDMRAYALSPEELAEAREEWVPDEACVDKGTAEPSGCGCSTVTGPGGAFMLSFGALFAWARRRKRSERW